MWGQQLCRLLSVANGARKQRVNCRPATLKEISTACSSMQSSQTQRTVLTCRYNVDSGGADLQMLGDEN